MNELLNGYKEYLTQRKSASANTLQSYVRDIKQFLDFNTSEITEVSPKNIEKYLLFLENSGKNLSTVTRALASIRSFYHYLMYTGVCFSNPAEKVKTKKAEKKLPEILSQKEIDALLSAPDITEPKGCRDKAMLELLYATGMRVSELIDLNVEDFNFQIGIVHCTSAKHNRVIPVYYDAIKAINDYMSRVRPVISLDRTQKALFINLNGERLTRQGFWKIMKKYADIAGIKKTITPHTIRHSFATHLLENGAGLDDIKEMLGHSDISSTQIYNELMKQKYATAYRKFHPRAGQ